MSGEANPIARPPSVEGAARRHPADREAHEALVRAARAVVEDERTRLRSGGRPAPLDELASLVETRLAAPLARPPAASARPA
jgi:hypothetical protein